MLEKGSLSQNDLYGCSNSSGDDAKGHGAYAAIFKEKRNKMRLRKEIEITDFLDAVKKTKGEVWLESKYGDRYNLKSTLSCYVAIAAMIKNCCNELELYCSDITDEGFFYEFFEEHPETL